MQTGLNKVGVNSEEFMKTEDKKTIQIHELEDNWFCKVLFLILVVTYFRDFVRILVAFFFLFNKF